MIDDINIIIEEVCRKDSIYDSIIDNFLVNKKDRQLKNELLSEIAMYWLEKPEKVLKAYNEKYFKYYFIKTIMNQVKSKSSSFHRNVRSITSVEYSAEKAYDIQDTDYDEMEIELKIQKEIDIDIIDDALSAIDASWFDKEMFRIYFGNDITYREMETEYDVDHCLAWVSVDKVKKRIKQHIKTKKG